MYFIFLNCNWVSGHGDEDLNQSLLFWTKRLPKKRAAGLLSIQQAVVCVYLGWSGLHKADKRDRRGETKLETQIHCSFSAKCKILLFGRKSDICKTVGNKKPLNTFFLYRLAESIRFLETKRNKKKKHTTEASLSAVRSTK